jgi:hypothetical protein
MKRLREFIRWFGRLARRSRNESWDEDPINLQVPKELQDSEGEGCEFIFEDLDNMGGGEW